MSARAPRVAPVVFFAAVPALLCFLLGAYFSFQGNLPCAAGIAFAGLCSAIVAKSPIREEIDFSAKPSQSTNLVSAPVALVPLAFMGWWLAFAVFAAEHVLTVAAIPLDDWLRRWRAARRLRRAPS